MDESSGVNLTRVSPQAPENATAKLDVVYIHGLGGCAKETWTNSSGDYWPQWVADDNQSVQVWVLDYPAKIGKLLDIGSDQPGTGVLSTLIMEKLVTSGIGHRPCIFVCHSLGGLIAKRILLDANQQDIHNSLRFQHENVKGLMFCGTPHRGSAIADVLTYLEGAKNTLPSILQCLGWLGGGGAGLVTKHATKSILTTSELIEELRNNNVNLQFLNEQFGAYFGERAKSGFLVKVFAETESTKGAIVVSADSANPNLRFDSKSAALPVIPVPSKDHSQLVKPDHTKEFVVEGLTHLISLVAGGELAFNLDNEWQSRMAAQFHAELLKCPDVVKFSCFPTLSGEHQDFELARHLAQLTDEAIIDQLRSLNAGFGQIPKNDPLFDRKHAGLLNIGTILLLTYIHNYQTLSVKSNPGDLIEIGTPNFDGPEELILLAEAIQAAVRHWPLKIKLTKDKSAVTWGSRVYAAAAAAPCSWREDDHFNHFVQRINASNTLTADKFSGIELGEVIAEAERTELSARDVQKAKRLLESHMQKQLAHVLNGLEPSSPYATELMKQKLNKEFGPLLSVLLPDPDKPNQLLETLLINAQVDAQQFLLEALSAMESRP